MPTKAVSLGNLNDIIQLMGTIYALSFEKEKISKHAEEGISKIEIHCLSSSSSFESVESTLVIFEGSSWRVQYKETKDGNYTQIGDKECTRLMGYHYPCHSGRCLVAHKKDDEYVIPPGITI